MLRAAEAPAVLRGQVRHHARAAAAGRHLQPAALPRDHGVRARLRAVPDPRADRHVHVQAAARELNAPPAATVGGSKAPRE